MCGIVGHISLSGQVSGEELTAACETLKHRGPDYFSNKLLNKNIGLGHTRLSFLDLGVKGNQPMFNGNKTSCITFNGEIYNYLELKQELATSYNFQTTTDTEVLLAAYEKWGIKMVEKLDGMFAFALIDLSLNKTFLVRDRFGIKPLYYYLDKQNLIVSSELKALFKFKAFKKELNKSALCDYFVYRYVPSPKTIWEDTYKLEPACYKEFDNTTLGFKTIQYWQPKMDNKSEGEKSLVSYIGQELESSVVQHARADVPIGTFLSGGYDSSAIAAYLAKINPETDTFSIGFSEWEKSEDYFAKIVANHLHLKNSSVVADVNSLELINLMPMVYDEPIADISIIPTYMVSQLAHKKVKAVMSGEGADELFGGYHWQKDFYKLSYPEDFLKKLANYITPIDTVAFYANAMSMGAFDEQELKQMLHPNFHSAIEKDVHWFYRKHFQKELSPLKSIQYLDMKCFMGELVLTKVDRASMANSLEVRVPFLDHRLFEKIFQTEEKDYFKQSQTKFLLYKNIKDKLPEKILDRNKQGFVGPDSYYMNKDWYREQLKSSSLVKHEVIKQDYIDQLLKKDYDWRIWKILVMEKWYAQWMT